MGVVYQEIRMKQRYMQFPTYFFVISFLWQVVISDFNYVLYIAYADM